MLKELGKGDWTIDDIRNHFAFLKQHGGRTFGMYKTVNARYANRTVNPAYYGKITINEPIKYLTQEEFRAGKPGYVLSNFRINTPKI